MIWEEAEAAAWLEERFWQRSYAERVRSWMPRRCYYSGQQLWLRQVVKRTQIITGPGEPAEIVRWIDPHTHTILSLQK